MQNYLQDLNRFKLAAPPAWWLQKLWDFDASLVVVPSRQACIYRLAQRRPLQLRENMTNDALFNESDTKMLAQYSLIPVTTILANPNWSNPFMFEELRRRAPHRMGGAEQAARLVEAQEQQEADQKQADVDDITSQVAKDGWGMYQKKIGIRSHMYIPKTKPKTAPMPSLAPSIVITDR